MPIIDSPLSLFLASLVLGLTHALEADHIAAVSTLATQKFDFKGLLKLGSYWGLGHTISIILVGLAVLFFKVQLPALFAPILESLVGAMLIFLGVRLIKKIYQEKIHFHIHKHDNSKHAHFHSHLQAKSHEHEHRSFFIGLIHGLAGSAAMVILVLTTIESIGYGLVYLLIFGAGSIIGMAVVSSLIGLPLKFLSQQKSVIKGIQYLAAVISIIIGSSIIIEFAQAL